MIKDSGNRREFDTGAVRDMQTGKGRCDLLPLSVVSKLYPNDFIPGLLAKFQIDQDTAHLYEALRCFAVSAFGSKETMLLETAQHFEEGAEKYGENNWQKGLPANCYVDSALRHWFKYKRGDNDENHHRAFVWNILCCIWEVDHHAYD
jgi:hypothetical protein